MQDTSRSMTQWCTNTGDKCVHTHKNVSETVSCIILFVGQHKDRLRGWKWDSPHLTSAISPTTNIQQQEGMMGAWNFRFGFRVQTAGSCCSWLLFKDPQADPGSPSAVSVTAKHPSLCLSSFLPLSGQPATSLLLRSAAPEPPGELLIQESGGWYNLHISLEIFETKRAVPSFQGTYFHNVFFYKLQQLMWLCCWYSTVSVFNISFSAFPVRSPLKSMG